jgi:hypothetical protein
MKAVFVVVFCAAILSGCAQELISGNAAGGMVSGGDNLLESRAGAMQIADAHCKKYGRIARVSGQDPWAGTLTFDCVTP